MRGGVSGWAGGLGWAVYSKADFIALVAYRAVEVGVLCQAATRHLAPPVLCLHEMTLRRQPMDQRGERGALGRPTRSDEALDCLERGWSDERHGMGRIGTVRLRIPKCGGSHLCGRTWTPSRARPALRRARRIVANAESVMRLCSPQPHTRVVNDPHPHVRSPHPRERPRPTYAASGCQHARSMAQCMSSRRRRPAYEATKCTSRSNVAGLPVRSSVSNTPSASSCILVDADQGGKGGVSQVDSMRLQGSARTRGS